MLGRGSVLDRHRFCVAAEFDVSLLVGTWQAFCVILVPWTAGGGGGRGASRSRFSDNSSSCTKCVQEFSEQRFFAFISLCAD